MDLEHSVCQDATAEHNSERCYWVTVVPVSGKSYRGMKMNSPQVYKGMTQGYQVTAYNRDFLRGNLPLTLTTYIFA